MPCLVLLIKTMQLDVASPDGWIFQRMHIETPNSQFLKTNIWCKHWSHLSASRPVDLPLACSVLPTSSCWSLEAYQVWKTETTVTGVMLQGRPTLPTSTDAWTISSTRLDQLSHHLRQLFFFYNLPISVGPYIIAKLTLSFFASSCICSKSL